MALDLGTGDGRAVLAAAAARPDTLVIGVDASAAGMAKSSRRASQLPNALFVAAAAERPALCGIADAITVSFPWASLLRGVLGADDAVLAGIAALAAPGATVSSLVSVMPRDGFPALPGFDSLAEHYARHGLRLVEARPATAEEIAASRSSWAKRLRAGSARPVTLLKSVETRTSLYPWGV